MLEWIPGPCCFFQHLIDSHICPRFSMVEGQAQETLGVGGHQTGVCPLANTFRWITDTITTSQLKKKNLKIDLVEPCKVYWYMEEQLGCWAKLWSLTFLRCDVMTHFHFRCRINSDKDTCYCCGEPICVLTNERAARAQSNQVYRSTYSHFSGSNCKVNSKE